MRLLLLLAVIVFVFAISLCRSAGARIPTVKVGNVAAKPESITAMYPMLNIHWQWFREMKLRRAQMERNKALRNAAKERVER